MGCLRSNEANAPVVVSFCLSSLFAIDLKTKWIHMKQEQLLIQFCCQKEHMNVMKCQLTWEVWAWPGCSLHMTKFCCKQSRAFTPGHTGVCMIESITQKESLRRSVSWYMRSELDPIVPGIWQILVANNWRIHTWSCRCLHERVMRQLTCYWNTKQISTNHTAMASNTPAFKAALTRILFTNKVAEALIGEGITSLGNLMSLSSEDIKTLCKVIREDAENEITFMNQ